MSSRDIEQVFLPFRGDGRCNQGSIKARFQENNWLEIFRTVTSGLTWRRINECPKRTQKHSQLGSRSSPRSPGTDASFSFATVKCQQIQVGGSNGFNFRYEADASETCKFKQELSKELSAQALTRSQSVFLANENDAILRPLTVMFCWSDTHTNLVLEV
jgi:hypothetical protein